MARIAEPIVIEAVEVVEVRGTEIGAVGRAGRQVVEREALGGRGGATT